MRTKSCYSTLLPLRQTCSVQESRKLSFGENYWALKHILMTDSMSNLKEYLDVGQLKERYIQTHTPPDKQLKGFLHLDPKQNPWSWTYCSLDIFTLQFRFLVPGCFFSLRVRIQLRICNISHEHSAWVWKSSFQYLCSMTVSVGLGQLRRAFSKSCCSIDACSVSRVFQ